MRAALTIPYGVSVAWVTCNAQPLLQCSTVPNLTFDPIGNRVPIVCIRLHSSTNDGLAPQGTLHWIIYNFPDSCRLSAVHCPLPSPACLLPLYLSPRT